MKKCSHSAHESLTELNITPMLDLAFVLLVIFIISTIPPVKKMDLTLPVASKHQKDPPHKAYYISVLSDGNLYINRDDCKLAGMDDFVSKPVVPRELASVLTKWLPKDFEQATDGPVPGEKVELAPPPHRI